jgi:hypothetical protein
MAKWSNEGHRARSGKGIVTGRHRAIRPFPFMLISLARTLPSTLCTPSQSSIYLSSRSRGQGLKAQNQMTSKFLSPRSAKTEETREEKRYVEVKRRKC